ncbi:hypothetical protein VHUM_01980 [Vanrija humicola]|uniref:Glycosyltransferase 61 catalytic domain-containing protein n=1 Tax=Vanrija humicola TaxID=5417 RepID=A0A7D8V217_VANHU|nr:hypothetical protein VHUM_01980 [Vanrija humicola]
MSWHVTRRDILLILILIVLFGLFLQLDLSFRFTNSSGSDSLLGFRLGVGGRKGWGHNSGTHRLPDLTEEAREGGVTAGISDAKVKWGDEGAQRTEVLAHAPGWTIFDDIYLLNGTFYIVTEHPSSIPLLRMMASTGREIWNDEESIKGREPTERDMRIVFPSEAKRLWGHSASRVSGTTLLVNDPPQFLDHYYHFAAELLFGLWRTYSSLDPSIDALGKTHLPAPARMMMPHVQAGKWNDYAKMNSFLTRAIFPAMSYEYQNDFHDRTDTGRAYVFDRVVFADRAAAFRGPEFAKTWRTAAEAVANFRGSRYWWAPVRRNLLEFVGSAAGVHEINLDEYGIGMDELDEDIADVTALEEHNNVNDQNDAPQFVKRKEEEALAKRAADTVDKNKLVARTPGTPVITYVSRQDWGRRMLKKKDHEGLVAALKGLEKKYGWEVNIVAMDKLSRDDQIHLAARTTIMMGVHGNGLTHLLWMNNLNPRATIMEFFFPGGFSYDYAWTARALGIRHYGWWGNESFTAPNTPPVAYPEGFQGNEIPLDGKAVADLIEQRLLVDRARD